MVLLFVGIALAQAGVGVATQVGSAAKAKAEVDWTRITKAALRGDPEAAYRLGRSFEEKSGPRARQRAFEWLGKAANEGHADAMFHLSRMHARAAREKLESGGDARAVLEAGERDAERWLREAKRLGSLDAFAWACASAFAGDAPAAMRSAARADCYLGFRTSPNGSPSRDWFQSKLEALPRWPDFLQDLDFRARLIPHAALVPDDAALLVNRIRPSKFATRLESRPELMPLAVGHAWTFETKDGEEFVEHVVRRHTRAGREWFEIETQTRSRTDRARPRMLRIDPTGLHQEIASPSEGGSSGEAGFDSGGAREPSLVFPFPAGVGSEVVIQHGPRSVEVVRVDAERIRVQTPAGRFDCVRYSVYEIDLDSEQARPRHTTVDIAPGIGVVQRQASHGGPHFVLTGYDLSEGLPAATR